MQTYRPKLRHKVFVLGHIWNALKSTILNVTLLGNRLQKYWLIMLKWNSITHVYARLAIHNLNYLQKYFKKINIFNCRKYQIGMRKTAVEFLAAKQHFCLGNKTKQLSFELWILVAKMLGKTIWVSGNSLNFLPKKSWQTRGNLKSNVNNISILFTFQRFLIFCASTNYEYSSKALEVKI